METEHIFYPEGEHDNRTTPDVAPDKRPSPQPATRREARELDRLTHERGHAFDVYLDHIWNGIEPIMNMEADFENLYWASYEKLQTFADDFINNLGWADARTQLLHDLGVPKNILVFDRHAFLDHLRGEYEFHERGGETHVFIA